MANLGLEFNILARDQASAKFRDIGNAADRAGRQTSNFGSTVASGMKIAAGAFLGAGLIQGFRALYEAADEARKISALTTQVIKTTGGAANVSAKQVSDLAGAIAKKTGIDDEAIQSGQNLLLTFMNVRNEVGKGNDIFSQATSLVTDMSVALGKDLNSSALTVGKALNDPIAGLTALSRAGVQFTAQQKEQIRTLVESGQTLEAQKIILDELGKEFGGAAEAAATPLDKLRQRAGDLAEQVGTYLLPIIDDFATFAGDKLLPALQDIGGIVGSAVIPAFQAIGTIVGAAADVFNALPGPLQAVAVALGAYLILKGPLASVFETIGLKALYMKDSLAGATTSVSGFKGAMSTLASAFTPVTLGITAAVLILPSLIDLFKKMTGNSDSAASSQRTLAAALAETTGVMDENARTAAQQALVNEDLVDILDRAGVSGRDAIDGLLGNASAQERVNEALQDYTTELLVAEGTTSTNVTAVADARDKYLQLAESLGLSRTEAEFFADAAVTTAGATDQAAAGTEALTTAADDNRTALSEARQAVDDFKLALDLLSGANVDAARLSVAFHDAVREASTALEGVEGSAVDAAGGLNTQSEAGSRAADVLFDIRDRANDWIATMEQQGATTDEVVAKDAELREAFIQSAEQMGFNRQQAENLAVAYYGIPEERNTQITADTTQATNAVNSLQALINGLKGRTVDIIARAIMPDLNGSVSGSGRPGMATGGPVFGPGTGTSDSIPAMLSNGEHVLTAREVRAAGGHGAIKEWRKSLKGYADGGPVAPVSIVAELNARAYDTQMNALAGQVLKSYEPVQGYIGALNWAKSQVGKPYIWGGVGPAGYDCSGFMSAITNVIRGRSPHSRVGSTASFPWAGFGAGGGIYTIGSTSNAGGGIGHMAGTLIGVNVESTGGVGVKVGGSARGAMNGLFNERASLRMANGGVIGEPVSGIGHYSGRSYSFGERGPETVTPGLPGSLAGIEVTGRLEFDQDGMLRLVDGRIVQAFNADSDRQDYNG